MFKSFMLKSKKTKQNKGGTIETSFTNVACLPIWPSVPRLYLAVNLPPSPLSWAVAAVLTEQEW